MIRFSDSLLTGAPPLLSCVVRQQKANEMKVPDTWYYFAGGMQCGPISSDELANLARSGVLKPTDMILKHGMVAWIPASRVKNLFPTVFASPSQPRAAAPSPTAQSGNAVAATSPHIATPFGDFEDESETTRKRLPSKKPKKSATIIGAIAASALLLSCVVCGTIGAIFIPQRETPEVAYIASQKAAAEGDWGAFFDRTTNEHQKSQILGAEIMKTKDASKSHLKNLSGKKLWIAMMKDATKDENKQTLEPIEIVSTEITGNDATIKARRGKGEVYTIRMVKQDGSWRMIIPGL